LIQLHHKKLAIDYI